METKLKPYMVFSRHVGPEEGAVLVFHFTSRQARYLGWQHEPLMGCEYIDSASWLIRDPENVYPLTNHAWLVDNQPHAIVSPAHCRSCEFWGCGVDANGRCNSCGEPPGDYLLELFRQWRVRFGDWSYLKTAVIVERLERWVEEMGVSDYERIIRLPEGKEKFERFLPGVDEVYDRWERKPILHLSKEEEEAYELDFESVTERLDIHRHEYYDKIKLLDNDGLWLLEAYTVTLAFSKKTRELFFFISDVYEDERYLLQEEETVKKKRKNRNKRKKSLAASFSVNADILDLATTIVAASRESYATTKGVPRLPMILDDSVEIELYMVDAPTFDEAFFTINEYLPRWWEERDKRGAMLPKDLAYRTRQIKATDDHVEYEIYLLDAPENKIKLTGNWEDYNRGNIQMTLEDPRDWRLRYVLDDFILRVKRRFGGEIA